MIIIIISVINSIAISSVLGGAGSANDGCARNREMRIVAIMMIIIIGIMIMIMIILIISMLVLTIHQY